MSQLRVNAVTDETGGNTATINGMTPTADSLQGFRNRLINSDMRIDQRNAGASVGTSAGVTTYTLDRWEAVYAATNKFTVQRNAGSVTPPTGFSNYLGVTSSSAYAVSSTDFFFVRQKVEGFNSADLAWGTASASAVTLSFWVRSSITGTFGGALNNSNSTRSYPYSFIINAANTWEYKTVTIPGDTTGTWDTTNGTGVMVVFSFGVGSTLSGTAGAWSGSNLVSATGATSVVGTSGATFYITGVQLEAGSVATPFERRPYGTELALCQRYFEKSFDQTTAPVQNAGSIQGAVTTSGVSTAVNTLMGYATFAAEKRTAPTMTTFNPFAAGSGWSQSGALNLASNIYSVGTRAVSIRVNDAPTLTGTNILIHWTASAEL